MKLKILAGMVLVLIVITVLVISSWSRMINMMMPADSRPGKIGFVVESVSSDEFDKIANDVSANYDLDFTHIERFKEEGILAYEGPQTCLSCHEEITINDAITGDEKTVNLMDNLTGSAHYSFYTKSHPNVYGFNGKLADNFPMGKIDRPCPKPGSFAFTAWAEFVVTEHGDTLSEGCGQCHIGGQYQAPLGERPWQQLGPFAFWLLGLTERPTLGDRVQNISFCHLTASSAIVNLCASDGQPHRSTENEKPDERHRVSCSAGLGLRGAGAQARAHGPRPPGGAQGPDEKLEAG